MCGPPSIIIDQKSKLLHLFSSAILKKTSGRNVYESWDVNNFLNQIALWWVIFFFFKSTHFISKGQKS